LALLNQVVDPSGAVFEEVTKGLHAVCESPHIYDGSFSKAKPIGNQRKERLDLNPHVRARTGF
jgi:hypothetical protein